jgi:hypothetical protein
MSTILVIAESQYRRRLFLDETTRQFISIGDLVDVLKSCADGSDAIREYVLVGI